MPTSVKYIFNVHDPLNVPQKCEELLCPLQRPPTVPDNQMLFGYTIWKDTVSVKKVNLKSIVVIFSYPMRDFVIYFNGFTLFLGFAANKDAYSILCKCCHSVCFRFYIGFIANRVKKHKKTNLDSTEMSNYQLLEDEYSN